MTGSGVLYVIDQSTNELDVLTGTPPGLKQAIQFPLGLINLAGRSAATRFYAISQNVGPTVCANPASVVASGVTGVASALEAATNTISATLPVGICPVYGLGSADGLRAFILNRGSGTVTVIDAQKNTLDTQINPTTGLPNSTLTLPAGPVYAELYDATSQLVTANYDSNTISVIDVTTDAFDNDAPTFGTIHNVTVGSGPSSVTVLQDGSRAYVANSNDGTVSVVNLSSYTVERHHHPAAESGWDNSAPADDRFDLQLSDRQSVCELAGQPKPGDSAHRHRHGGCDAAAAGQPDRYSRDAAERQRHRPDQHQQLFAGKWRPMHAGNGSDPVGDQSDGLPAGGGCRTAAAAIEGITAFGPVAATDYPWSCRPPYSATFLACV